MSGCFLFILLVWLLVIARSCLVEQNVFVRNFQIRCVSMTRIESCWDFNFESLLWLVVIAV